MPLLVIAFVGFLLSIGWFFLTQGKAKAGLPRLSIKSAAICWGTYLAWEIFASAVGWNIRIDLLVIYPVLLAVSLWAIAHGGLSLFKRN